MQGIQRIAAATLVALMIGSSGLMVACSNSGGGGISARGVSSDIDDPGRTVRDRPRGELSQYDEDLINGLSDSDRTRLGGNLDRETRDSGRDRNDVLGEWADDESKTDEERAWARSEIGE